MLAILARAHRGMKAGIGLPAILCARYEVGGAGARLLNLTGARYGSFMVPILDNKDSSAPSIFRPAALLREARRQKGLAAAEIPPICILDPDGDIVRHIRRTGEAQPFKA